MISVVIACYNVEKYVTESINSVISQTYRDLEIICVDDGSTDNTSAILDDFAKKDARIKIVRHEKNKGLFAVRCSGTNAATGEYLMFLDGDDYLHAEACECSLEVMKHKNVDIVHFDISLVLSPATTQEDINILEKRMKPCFQNLPQTTGSLVNACFVDKAFNWTVWGKLYKTAIVRSAVQFFEDERLIMAEDMLLSFMLLVFASGYAPLNKKLCYYRLGSGVTTATQYISLEKLRVFAEEYQVYGLLKKWLTKLRKEKTYFQALECVHDHIRIDMLYATYKTDLNDFEKAVNTLLQYWPARELGITLTSNALREKNQTINGELAWALRKLDTPAPRPIKTIGMFYYRMYNGGIERVLAQLSSILTKNGYNVVLITEEVPNSKDYPLPKNVKREVIFPIGDHSIENIETRFDAWDRIISTHHIDAIIYHAWLDPSMPEDSIAIKSLNIPFILHTHSVFCCNYRYPDIQMQYRGLMQKKRFALCDVIVALSDVDCAWYRAQGMRAVKIQNPQSFEIENILPAKLDGTNILWVGRISEEKQPISALKTMEIVHQKLPDATLHVVGDADDPEYKKRFNDYLIEKKMQSYVKLHGYCENMHPFYSNASLVLWTSKYEGAPMGMLEAQIYGLPIVTFDIPNVELIREHKGIYVVPQKDYNGAAAHIIHLLENQELRQNAGKLARENAESMSNSNLIKHWHDIFELSMHEKEPAKLDSEVEPIETAVRMVVTFLSEGIKKELENPDPLIGVASNSVLEGMYKDGYFVKLYNLINRLFPKGGRKRELIKKVASLFFK